VLPQDADVIDNVGETLQFVELVMLDDRAQQLAEAGRRPLLHHGMLLFGLPDQFRKLSPRFGFVGGVDSFRKS
jgi:hypothetical protein